MFTFVIAFCLVHSVPSQASMKDLSATTESTLTGSSGSLKAATILCMAALKLR